MSFRSDVDGTISVQQKKKKRTLSGKKSFIKYIPNAIENSPYIFLKTSVLAIFSVTVLPRYFNSVPNYYFFFLIVLYTTLVYRRSRGSYDFFWERI